MGKNKIIARFTLDADLLDQKPLSLGHLDIKNFALSLYFYENGMDVTPEVHYKEISIDGVGPLPSSKHKWSALPDGHQLGNNHASDGKNWRKTENALEKSGLVTI